METQELREKFLKFFEKRDHKIVSSSSLIPDDPSVLLTTAGMQQFKKYYTSEADPLSTIHSNLGTPLGSKNAASIQKSFRTSDIDEVGDDSHLTFFEMLGNFSFGGYFKKEAITHAYNFIISELGLKIDYVSVFGGEGEVPADTESEKIWKRIEPGIEVKRFGRADNFWGPTGKEGPCGPTTEIYLNGVEVWNIVFNEYYQKPDGALEKLKTPGVDTGMGLERLAMISQRTKNIFETDLFAPLMELLPMEIEIRHKRIIVDHLRGSTFLLADGVRPSNKERGYILRRLIRRALVYESAYKIPPHVFDAVIHDIVHEHGTFYPELLGENNAIREEFRNEKDKFGKTLERGIKELRAVQEDIGSESAFRLYESYGLPYEIIRELAEEKAKNLTREAFDEEFKKHQEISRAGQERKFGGHGLMLDTGELKAADERELGIVTRLHTATHLLNAALHKVLGDKVEQRGSDITVERTRFDFLFPRKLTPEEIARIEASVNYAIEKDFPVTIQKTELEEAKKSGALFFYKGVYPKQVKVYTIGDDSETFSKELCGGPHVARTGEIGRVRIVKEESSSAGIRRIRAKLE